MTMPDLDDPLFPPWGVVTPAYWSGAPDAGEAETTMSSSAASPPLADLRAQVNGALARGDTQTALRLAAELDAQVTAACGEMHPDTADARELRGWVVWCGGDSASAVRWYLHTTGLHAQLTTPAGQKTLASVRRAIAAWDELDVRGRRALADELLTVVAHTSGSDSQLWRHVHARMPAD